MTSTGYQNKTVIVTGAASGMGNAVALKLVAAGAIVIGADIAPVSGDGITGKHLDLTRPDSIDSFVAELEDESIAAVFHCAGLPQTFAAAQVLTVNFVGARYLLESLLAKLAPDSAVTVVASLVIAWPQHVESLMPLINTSGFAEGVQWAESEGEGPCLAVCQNDPYMYSKEALACWSTMMAPRWIQRGVRLNVIGPGPTNTPMMGEFEKVVGEVMATMPQPMGRNSTPEEQADVMLFMNHPACSYLVGATIYVDGGLSASLMTMAAAGLME